MSETTTPADTIRELTKDTVVTVTDVDGNEFTGKVARVDNHVGSDGMSVLITSHNPDEDRFRLYVYSDDRVTFDLFMSESGEDNRDLAVINTHGVRVDWDETVGTSEMGLTYVVDCPECGGRMSRNGQHWPRSPESYECSSCGHTDSWRRSHDAVRKPTRREWAEHTLTDPSPYVTIPDRYVPDGYEKPGYYFREYCPADGEHYTRCRTSETGSADFHKFDDLKVGICPECGAETRAKTKTYSNGMDAWGTPEDHGERFPDNFEDALDAVRTGEVALMIETEPETGWGYTYEGIHYESPWISHGDHAAYVVLRDDELYFNIVGAGAIRIDPQSKPIGEVAWVYKNASNAELIPVADYEAEMESQATAAQ